MPFFIRHNEREGERDMEMKGERDKKEMLEAYTCIT